MSYKIAGGHVDRERLKNALCDKLLGVACGVLGAKSKLDFRKTHKLKCPAHMEPVTIDYSKCVGEPTIAKALADECEFERYLETLQIK
jgi:hypothetical protein